MGDLKVDGIKLVLLISILGTENVSIIQMTTSPVSSALCQVHNEQEGNCNNPRCYRVEEKLEQRFDKKAGERKCHQFLWK